MARLLVASAPVHVNVRMLSLTPIVARGHTIEQVWRDALGEDMSASLAPMEGLQRTYIIDSAQLSYSLDADHPFWRSLKHILEQPVGTGRVSVLLMAAYGLSYPTPSLLGPPATIPQPWSLLDLLATQAEVDDVFGRFNSSSTSHLCPAMSPVIQATISRLTGAHIGLIRSALFEYNYRFKGIPSVETGPSGEQEADFTTEILLWLGYRSPRQRALPDLQGMSAQALNYVLKVASAGVGGLAIMPAEYGTVPAELFTAGVLIAVESPAAALATLKFSSPLMYNHAVYQIFAMRPPNPVWRPGEPLPSAAALARNIVKRIVRGTLISSQSVAASGNLLERQYQMSFFAAAMTCLPVGTAVSPDYGRMAGIPGYLDFYINGQLSIGVELTRDRQQLSSHVRRFADGGPYAPVKLRDWVVVDFSQQVPSPDLVQSHTRALFVVFSADFKTAKIIQHGYAVEDV